MNRILTNAIPFLFLLIASQVTAQDRYAGMAGQKMGHLLNIIEQTYVDSVDGEHLIDIAIVKMLEELDPHSMYIPVEDLRRMNEPLQGKFEGVGIQFQLIKDTIVVISPIIGGPSYKLGILSGDRIVTIDEDTVAGVGYKNEDVMSSLRGEKGTVVRVGIRRGYDDQLLNFDIKRDKIPIYSVDAGYMISDKTGYIKVSRFAKETVEEMEEKFKSLEKAGMENLILDLRGNLGGYLNTATKMADEFLAGRKLIVYTEGRTSPRQETHSGSKGRFEKGNLIVLIDEGSASASEILSGAVQDWDRGLIMGRRSFGKGLVQKSFNLPDQSQVRVTVSRYYTPTGRSIQRSYEDGVEAYQNDIRERYEHGELLVADSIDFPDSLKYYTKINQRLVYGGGGITPDVFVPLDTTGGSKFYTDLWRKGVFNQFSLKFNEKNRKKLLKKYESPESFSKTFEITDELLEDFIAFAEKEKIEVKDEDYLKSKERIHAVIKGHIARGVWGNEAYYICINTIDKGVLEAVKLIESDTFTNYKFSTN